MALRETRTLHDFELEIHLLAVTFIMQMLRWEMCGYYHLHIMTTCNFIEIDEAIEMVYGEKNF